MKNFLILVLLCISLNLTAQRKFYFSTLTGDDTRSSTQAQNSTTPWKSINQLNSFFSSLLPGDSVFFNRGETFYGNIIIGRSGTSLLPIIIAAYGTGAKPVITGMTAITTWSSLGSNLWKSNVVAGALPYLNLLAIRNIPVPIGRYPNITAPNKGYLTIQSTTSNTVTNSSLPLPSVKNFIGASLVLRRQPWIIDVDVITNQVGQTLTFSGTWAQVNFGFFIQNSLQCLDVQNEWYYNPAQAQVTMYSTSQPSGVSIPTLSTLFSATGSKTYINVSNLSFSGANDTIIKVSSSCNHITFKSCDVSNAGVCGVSGDGQYGKFNNGSITNTYNSALRLTGSYSEGLSDSIKNSGNVAGMGKSGDGQYYAVQVNGKNSFKLNTLDSCGNVAISFGGDSCKVDSNYITNYMFIKNDAGAIYSSNHSFNIYHGREIKGNIIVNGIGAAEGTNSSAGKVNGIYFDDFINGIDCSGNSIFNVGNVANASMANGIYLHNDSNLIVRNNTVYNAAGSQLYLSHDGLGRYADGTTYLVKNLTITNNVFFAKTAKQLVATMGYFPSGTDNIYTYGTIDSNDYCRPILEPQSINNCFTCAYTFHVDPSGTVASSYYSLDWFKISENIDANSKISPKAYDTLRAEYNPTAHDSLINKNGFSWIEANGTRHTRNFFLHPYSSVILIRDTAITIDLDAPVNAAPTVSITSPANSATFTAPANITINATASDADGSVTKVEFYNGATLLGSDLTNPYSFTWNSVAAGTYNLTAKATDDSGSVTTSSVITIVVANPTNVAPTVSITSPANGATFTAPASIIINATAADADGFVTKVDFYNGSTLLGTDNSSPYSFTWSGVAPGSYTITAKATDNSAAITTSSAIAITVTAPANVLPTVSITSPANLANFITPVSITFNATAADADGSVIKVDFYNGATLLGTDSTSPYSYTWNSVAAGSYTITAKATDNSGGVTTSSAISITVSNPNVLPTVSITSPANAANFTSPASITINATAADADGSVTKVDFYYGSTLIGTDNTSPYSFTWSGVSAGSYTLTAKATDNSSGVTTSSAISITVTNPNVAPTIFITNPASNASFISPANILITATAADADGTVSKVEFFNGATLLVTDNISPYSFFWNGVTPGTYTITGKVTDNNGAVTTSSGITITVTGAANIAPTVNITSPANGTGLTAPATITINANAADGDGSVARVDFYNGATFLGSDITSPYSFTWNSVAAGSYSITAKATDNNSAVTTSSAISVTVTNPNVAPTVSITYPDSNLVFTAPANIIITATAADADGSVAKVEFYNGTTLLGRDSIYPYAFTWSGVAAGDYIITAKATDNSGAVTTSVAIPFTVITPANVAPTVSITSPADGATFSAPATITLNATAADPDGSVTKVDFYNGATLLASDSTYPYSFTWSAVAAGSYSITAKATDNIGAYTNSAAISITVTTVITAPVNKIKLFNKRFRHL